MYYTVFWYIWLMLLIPLYAAGSDLPSLPAPLSFPPSTDGGGSGKVCRVPKHFPLFLKLSPYSLFWISSYVITIPYL